MRIQEIKKIFTIIFLFGFFLGIIYVNLFAKKYVASMGIFSDYFLEQYSLSKLKMEEYMWYIARVRIFPLVILAILGCTKLKKLAGSICILWTGFSSGLVLTAAVLKMNIKGIMLCLIGVVPHFICYVAGYIMVLLYLFTYPNSVWNRTKTISLIIFMLLGMLSECYVNPVLINIFIKSL